MLSKIMKRAHQLAKQMEGDYTARLSISLRQAWKEAKEMEVKLPELKGSAKQIAWADEIRTAVIENKEEALNMVRKVADKKSKEYQEEFRTSNTENYERAYHLIEKNLRNFIEGETTARGWIDTFKTVSSEYSTAAPVNIIGGIYQANNYFFKDIKGNLDVYDLLLEVA